MMVKPTTAELLQKVDSKFRLVIATAKRARQISEEENESTNSSLEEAPVTAAAIEIAEGKVKIKQEN